jgi:hypothetical protein
MSPFEAQKWGRSARALQLEQQRAEVVQAIARTAQAEKASGEGDGRMAVLFKTSAAALARLGDPRALPTLHDVQDQTHFGMKKSAKKAIQVIESGQQA